MTEEYTTLDALHADLRGCRHCAKAGYYIGSRPIFTGSQSARLVLIGQAPGTVEDELGYPFGGDAGRRLFRWLERAGWVETIFRETCYMTSVTKCFPGPAKSGRGDRTPTAVEQRLCRPWLDGELSLVQPEVIVPVGSLAVRLFFPSDTKLDQVVGASLTDDDGRVIIPLPHPSGASHWLNRPVNVGRLEQALYRLRTLRTELGL